MTETRKYEIARNAKTSLYEFHAEGCAHLSMASKQLEIMGEMQAATLAEAVNDFEEWNEDCIVHIAPCARWAGR